MRVRDMRRPQLDKVARDLGISHPQHYNLMELKEAVKARYRKSKEQRKG
jgi:hypothetical protein